MSRTKRLSPQKINLLIWGWIKTCAFILMVVVVPVLIVGYRLFQEVFPSWDVPSVVTNIATTPQTKQLPWLHTSGRFIFDENGQRVILRGVNVGSIEWAQPSWHPKAIDYLATHWVVNVIRIRVMEKDYVANKELFFRNLEWEFLRPAREHGLYVIIHPKVVDVSTDLAGENLNEMWHDIAERYKDDPSIIYDLMPEPHDVPMARIVSTYQRVIENVRSVSPRSLIFVSGDNWGRNINYYVDNPMPYPNIVYRTNPYNEAYFFPDQFEKIMKIYPTFIGEFGPAEAPFMSEGAVRVLLKIAAANDLGWTAWNFHSVGCPCLLFDADNFLPSSYGLLIKNALTD